jgi:hypothetical protein
MIPKQQKLYSHKNYSWADNVSLKDWKSGLKETVHTWLKQQVTEIYFHWTNYLFLCATIKALIYMCHSAEYDISAFYNYARLHRIAMGDVVLYY